MPTLIAWIASFTIATASAGPLVISPETPVLDNGGGPGVVQFGVDLAPEDKTGLTGTGSIAVAVTPSEGMETVGSDRVLINYNGTKTTPATVRLRKAFWVPNPSNEFSKDWLDGCSLMAEGRPSVKYTVVSPLSRGSYFGAVMSYMERHRNLSHWIGIHIDLGGIYVNDLVRYLVPEADFVAWAPFVGDPQTIAEGYKLGYRPEDLAASATAYISNPYGLYTIKAAGWTSATEIMALEAEYINQVRPVNDNFSFSLMNRVPTAYFLGKLGTLPPAMNSGEKDFTISSLYNKEQAAARIASVGLSATNVMNAFASDYKLEAYLPVRPHAAEAMARTHTDAAWRRDKPLALVVVSRSLEEGTFSEIDIIGTLANTHRLIVAQASSSADFLAAARTAHSRHGKFDIVVLAGHGNGLSASCLSIEDTAAFTELGGMLTAGATVMLASCSGAEYYPSALAARMEAGQSRAVHVAAAMQSAMPSARVVAAPDLINKAMVTFDPAAASSGERYRIYFVGSAVWGEVPGLAPRGTPRDWLRREFGPTQDWAALEQADSDGDGQPNWLEYRAGTNPRSGSDSFRISALQLAGGKPGIHWTGSCRNEHATSFKVFKASNLAAGAWGEVASEISRSVYGANSWADPTTAGNSGFYRVTVPVWNN